jgi:Flp pilus assembly protein TadG
MRASQTNEIAFPKSPTSLKIHGRNMITFTRRNTRRPLRNAKHKGFRAGAALIEFAIVAPLMILFSLGLIEMGRMTMVKQLLTNVSREGARLATLPTASSTEVQSQIQTQLNGSKIYGATVEISPSQLSEANAGTLVTVTVSVTSEQVSWLQTPLFMGGKNISATTVMRRESL